jgi:uncharacterized protein YukE
MSDIGTAVDLAQALQGLPGMGVFVAGMGLGGWFILRIAKEAQSLVSAHLSHRTNKGAGSDQSASPPEPSPRWRCDSHESFSREVATLSANLSGVCKSLDEHTRTLKEYTDQLFDRMRYLEGRAQVLEDRAERAKEKDDRPKRAS